MAIVLNGIETLPKISIAWVGHTNVTDDRPTDDSIFAKNGRTTGTAHAWLDMTSNTDVLFIDHRYEVTVLKCFPNTHADCLQRLSAALYCWHWQLSVVILMWEHTSWHLTKAHSMRFCGPLTSADNSKHCPEWSHIWQNKYSMTMLCWEVIQLENENWYSAVMKLFTIWYSGKCGYKY